MDREAHLQWCKDRALAYVKIGNLTDAFGSMCSDLGKHPDTEGHVEIQLGMVQLMAGMLGTAEAMTNWITGFN